MFAAGFHERGCLRGVARGTSSARCGRLPRCACCAYAASRCRRRLGGAGGLLLRRRVPTLNPLPAVISTTLPAAQAQPVARLERPRVEDDGVAAHRVFTCVSASASSLL
jgi:hypothetical protein